MTNIYYREREKLQHSYHDIFHINTEPSDTFQKRITNLNKSSDIETHVHSTINLRQETLKK